MKQFLVYFVLANLALTVQSIFFKGTKPDFVLVLICSYALRFGQFRGMTYGAVTGLLLDTLSGFIIGPNIISKSLAGFLIGTIRENLFKWNLIANTLVVAIFSVIDILLVYICLETFSNISFANRSWEISTMQIIYTIIASMILYPVLNTEKDDILTGGQKF